MSRARSSFPGESEKPIRRNPHHGREPPTSPRGPVSSCPRGAFGLLLSTCAPVSLVIALLWLVNAILLPQPDRLWQPTSEDGILHRALDASAAMLSQLQRTLGKDHSLASSAQERQKQEQEQTATSPTNSSQQAKVHVTGVCFIYQFNHFTGRFNRHHHFPHATSRSRSKLVSILEWCCPGHPVQQAPWRSPTQPATETRKPGRLETLLIHSGGVFL